MAEIAVKNAAGKDAGKVDLDDATFGIEPNVPLLHQVVTAQLAKRRAGTQSTKTRSEVRGGGAKPYRQKGTGNARQGSIRSPQFSGGGVAHGPKPRSYAQKTPKKMVKLALRSALSDRAGDGKVVVIDDWGFDSPSTKSARKALEALGLDGKVLVVMAVDDAVADRSFRNLQNVQRTTTGELSAYDVLCNDWIVFTESTLPAPIVEPSSGRVADAVSTVVDGAKSVAAVAASTVADAASAVADAVSDVAESLSGDSESDDDEDAAVPSPTDVSSESEADASPDHEDGSTSDASDDASVGDHPYGEGSHGPLAGDEQPDGYDIKGNADSMLYHTSASPHYGRTVAEVWFASEAAAEAAGFSKPASQQAADDSAADETESSED